MSRWRELRAGHHLKLVAAQVLAGVIVVIGTYLWSNDERFLGIGPAAEIVSGPVLEVGGLPVT